MRKTFKYVGRFLLISGLMMSFSANAQRETIDLSTRGPQVGESIPQFSLPDQNGDLWTQDSILGTNGAMLVFVRSAEW
ncbi:MAG: hypothetical protein JKY98_00355 [Gammaproteobacteria bacterium]|nr:hypothetical protein [Gammaproteobacteria bacterium]